MTHDNHSGAGQSALAFVNQRAVHPPAGSTAAQAVALADPSLAAALTEGRAYLTDGCGVRRDPGEVLEAGAILRVVVSARRPRPDADA